MSNSRSWIWIVVITLAIPLTCCGSGYLYLFFTTPVTWEYVSSRTTSQHDKLEFDVFLRGSRDYQYDDQGPRRVMFNAKRDSPDTAVRVRLLDVSVIASVSGELVAYEPGTLPEELSFTYGSVPTGTWAHWSGVPMAIEPSSGESLKIIVEVEITYPDQEPEILKLENQLVPKRHHRPIWSHMPSA